MTLTEMTQLIGEAYNLQRQHDFSASASAFRDLLKEMRAMSASEVTTQQTLDVYYGLGLAERALGNHSAALEAFQKSLVLADDALDMVSAAGVGSDLKNEEDDRFMMMGVMIKQRMAEMGVTA